MNKPFPPIASVSGSCSNNGRPVSFSTLAATPLLLVTRDDMRLDGSELDYSLGEFGACAVTDYVKVVRSCVLPQGGVGNRNVTGFKAFSDRNQLNAVHQGLIDVQAAQCGCRLSDMVMTANILPELNPDPRTTLRRPVLSSNLCPCGTHREEILVAARRAAQLYRESLCNE
jgi:nicotinate dehydrogenase subunit A